MNIHYDTSQDYAELASRMAVERLVCFVDYDSRSGDPIRDVAATRFDEKSEFYRYAVRARGIEYVCANTVEEFAKSCAAVNLEWILPHKEKVVPHVLYGI